MHWIDVSENWASFQEIGSRHYGSTPLKEVHEDSRKPKRQRERTYAEIERAYWMKSENISSEYSKFPFKDS
ncbi:MAG: hypothetical protein NTV34_04840 [Proteobacteria bacterium]|nr:hypothetical protein [Pseudomonadota bacterium]